jgi:predicted dehydrogenase
MSERRRVRRRQFLGGVAGVMAAGYGRMAFGYPANDAIRVGLIGTGGRCMGELLPEMKKVEGLKIAAVCDVWDERLDKARKEALPDALATKDYAEILARKDIDAVVIATPDHLHVPITIAACEAGKDVYVEKPLTHDLSEGEAVIAAEAKHRRIIQVGMQQRSMPQFQKAYEIVKSGGLGKIHRIHLSWNRNAGFGEGRPKYGIRPETVDWKRFLGPARDQPFDEVKFRNWRWFWDFGGGILTDLMVHFIDVANWFCDLDAPAVAVTLGENYITKGFWETPDTIETVLGYPEKQIQVFFEGTFVNARKGARLEFMGRDATLYLDRGRYEIHPEKGKGSVTEFVPGTGARGADFDPNVRCGLLHLTNWVECVRTRKTPNAPVAAGVSACKGAHLGNIALKKGGAARWEDVRRA